MRKKLIITAAIAALAVATLTANAQSNGHTSNASLASLIAGRTFITPSDRDDVVVAVHATSVASKPPSEEAAEKSAVGSKPAAARVAISQACQDAINRLKAQHQAEVAEDTAERTGDRSAAALAADRAEDAAEVQQWLTALQAARSACLPQRTAACQAAISNLQTVIQSWRSEELREIQLRLVTNWTTAFTNVRTAFSAVAAACGGRTS